MDRCIKYDLLNGLPLKDSFPVLNSAVCSEGLPDLGERRPEVQSYRPLLARLAFHSCRDQARH